MRSYHIIGIIMTAAILFAVGETAATVEGEVNALWTVPVIAALTAGGK